MAEKSKQKKNSGDNSQRMKQVEKEPDKKNTATRRQDKAGGGMGKQ